MKYACLVLFFLLCNAELYSQEKLDVITLKNGTIYKGTLAEHNPKEKTVIILVDGRTVELNSAEIQVLNEADNRAFIQSKRGFFHTSSIGMLLGNSGYENEANFQYNMVNGMRLNKWLLGAGTGVEMLRNNMTTPLFFSATYEFKEGRTTPFISGQLGRSVNLGYEERNEFYNNNQFKGGTLAGLNLGIKHNFSAQLGFILNAGYRYYNLEGNYDQSFWDGLEWQTHRVESNLYLHRFNLSMGLIFN